MASSLSLNRTRKVPAEDTAAFGAIAERFRRGGALERAVSLCREGLQKFPDHVSARVTLGWSLLDLGKYDEARLELEQVLRRAPDNLAAIRGLAELHDRFEHTLNLPMDGPGQWPPPPEATAHIADEPGVIAESGSADVEFAPAELGIPIWSPAAPAAMVDAVLDEDVEPEIVVHVAPAPVTPPAVAVAAAVPAPVAAVSAPAPPMTATASPAAAVGAGMSSVREIEMQPASEWAGISAAPAAESATIEIEPETAAAAFAGTDAVADDDPEMAALIAEAESLESAADLIRPSAAAAMTDVDVAIDDSAGFEFHDPALELSVAADASDEVDLPLVLDAAAPELAETAEVADAGEIIVHAGASDVADPSVELVAPDVVTEVVPGAIEPETLQAETLEAEASELSPSVIDGGPSFELTAFTPPEVVETDDDAVAVDAVAAAIDESIAPVLPFHVAPVHPALPRLERLLAKVQTRRSQLMAQSVA